MGSLAHIVPQRVAQWVYQWLQEYHVTETDVLLAFIFALVAPVVIAVILRLFNWLRGGDKYKASRHLRRAEVLQAKRDVDGALAELGRAKKLLEDSTRYQLLVKTYLMEGDIAADREDWDDAIKDYKRALENAAHLKEGVSLNSILYLKLGTALHRSGQLDDAFRFLDRAIVLAERSDSASLAQTYQQFAEVQRKRHNSDDAIENCLRAVTRAEPLGDFSAQANSTATMARCYLDKGIPKQAADNFRLAAKLYKKAGQSETAEILEREADELLHSEHSPSPQ
jgi:tetratricopeptide (TPR) repeat protein